MPTLSEAKKSVFSFRVGDKVKGTYDDVPFTGVIDSARPHTMNWNMTLGVKLDKPITVLGLKRDSVLLSVADDPGDQYHYSKFPQSIELVESAPTGDYDPRTVYFESVSSVGAPTRDASELGLRPGYWPNQLQIDGEWYRRGAGEMSNGELVGYTYIEVNDGSQIMVFNESVDSDDERGANEKYGPRTTKPAAPTKNKSKDGYDSDDERGAFEKYGPKSEGLDESASDDEIAQFKIGDAVHAGLSQLGGAGFEGILKKIEGAWAWIEKKGAFDKFGPRLFKVPVKNLMYLGESLTESALCRQCTAKLS